MKSLLDIYKDVLIQIATPYSTGTGFYLKDYNLIITNEHVIRGNRRVVIDGELFRRQISRVLFLDTKHDLAFLEPPQGNALPGISLGEIEGIREGAPIIAIGHPFGLKFTATQGIISSTQQQRADILYLQHDAALNPGNSGGPLVDQSGKVLGINTFIVRDGNNIGFSLPVNVLSEILQKYRSNAESLAAMCSSCSNIVDSVNISGKYCPFCGTQIQLPHLVEEYEPTGVNKTIEMILESLSHDMELARIGPNHWQIIEGSAIIKLSYYEKNGLIIGDAYLVKLPNEGIQTIYEYLLKENYNMNALSFSVTGNEIILSLIIYDKYLNPSTGRTLLKNLFEKADYYDNILVEEYGAKWQSE